MDNVGYTPGTGASIAADEVGGVLHQRVKVEFGEDGSATDVSSANPLPVAVSNFPSPGLTDTQLRAYAVPVSGPFYQATQPVSAVVLPLPADAATETTVSAVNNKLPVLEGGRIPVVLPTGGSGLTNDELRATPVPVSGSFAVAPPDNTVALMTALRALVHPIWEEAASGRLRVVLDPVGGAQTLGTVTTVGTVNTVTSMNQVAAIPANSFIYDQMHAAWANSVRRAVS